MKSRTAAPIQLAWLYVCVVQSAGVDGLEQAAAVSNYAAGIVVAKLGTATASIPELERILK